MAKQGDSEESERSSFSDASDINTKFYISKTLETRKKRLQEKKFAVILNFD